MEKSVQITYKLLPKLPDTLCSLQEQTKPEEKKKEQTEGESQTGLSSFPAPEEEERKLLEIRGEKS